MKTIFFFKNNCVIANSFFIAYIYVFVPTSFCFGQCPPSVSNAASFSSHAFSGSISWSNPSNAQFSEDIRANSGALLSVLNSINTDYLDVENFGFAVPPSATICGIEVIVEKRQEGISLGSSIQDNNLQLLKNGTACGLNHASSVSWPLSDAMVTYGGPADLWGIAWTPADINANNFGCSFSAKINSGLAEAFLQAEVDCILMSVYFDPTILPIELMAFDLSMQEGKKVKLNWRTASEQNNNYFEIQCSSNKIDWKNIKTVAGAGNSNHPIDYSYIDEDPAMGISYYRLKQTDFNGMMTYGPVKSIEVDVREEISLASNIVMNWIVLNCNKQNDCSLTLYLYDIHGNLVKKTAPMEIKKEIPVSLKVAVNELSQGLYFYKGVTNNTEVIFGKILKQ